MLLLYQVDRGLSSLIWQWALNLEAIEPLASLTLLGSQTTKDNVNPTGTVGTREPDLEAGGCWGEALHTRGDLVAGRRGIVLCFHASIIHI